MRFCGLASTTAVLAVLLLSGSAHADGPHFMAEGGVSIFHGLSDPDSTETGAGTSLLLGVGGRPGDSWLRYYLLLELGLGGYDRTHFQNFREITLERGILEAGIGLRIVAPLFPVFRWFGDVELTLVSSDTELTGPHVGNYDSSELDGGFRFATGFQIRPAEFISAGLRVALTTTFDDFDSDGGRGFLVGFESEAGFYDAGLTLTFYF